MLCNQNSYCSLPFFSTYCIAKQRCSRCSANFGHFQHCTLRRGLEFSQNHNRITLMLCKTLMLCNQNSYYSLPFFSTYCIAKLRGVRGAVRILAIFNTALCGAIQSSAKTITALHLIFAVTCIVQCIRCNLNSLKLVYFSNFRLFLPDPKLIFPFVLGQVLNY